MIFVGVRDDLGIEPSHPRAESIPVSFSEAQIDITEHGEIIFPHGDAEEVVRNMKPGEDGNAAFQRINQTSGERWFGLKRLDYSKPSRTILKTIASGTIHPEIDRYLSETELKRIGSFPDRFFLTGNFSQKWQRIGNSVPPLFMRSIALHVKNEILGKMS